MTDWVRHRQELLRAYKISQGDLDANRAGQLGPAQVRRMRRGIGTNLLGGVVLAGGLVTVNMRGRAGWYLNIEGRSFRLPVRFWHVGRGVTYDVYIAPAAKLIVA